jgi:hypothetical protein
MKNLGIKKNLVTVYPENGYSEFVTTFTVKHCDNGEMYPRLSFEDVLGTWAPIIKKALESRMESCISMLFRNRNNIISANEFCIRFKKNNGMIHSFNHPPFKVMEDAVAALDSGYWKFFIENPRACEQIAKAIYWVSEEDRKDRTNISFGNLISCIHELLLCGTMKGIE